MGGHSGWAGAGRGWAGTGQGWDGPGSGRTGLERGGMGWDGTPEEDWKNTGIGQEEDRKKSGRRTQGELKKEMIDGTIHNFTVCNDCF